MYQKETPDSREEKLPLWAKAKLSELRGKVARLEDEITKFWSSETDVWLESYTTPPVGLPPGSRIRFRLDGNQPAGEHRGAFLDVRIDKGPDNTVLEVMVVNGHPAVMPRAGNVIDIAIVER